MLYELIEMKIIYKFFYCALYDTVKKFVTPKYAVQLKIFNTAARVLGVSLQFWGLFIKTFTSVGDDYWLWFFLIYFLFYIISAFVWLLLYVCSKGGGIMS